ncbi:hypothetical protein CRG49_008200 [Neisseria sp. N95_16]|nr:hypothetical protein CRG49_008200 [Neisseria sp. N95_16]
MNGIGFDFYVDELGLLLSVKNFIIYGGFLCLKFIYNHLKFDRAIGFGVLKKSCSNFPLNYIYMILIGKNRFHFIN